MNYFSFMKKTLFIVFMGICALMAPYQYCIGQETSRDSSIIAEFCKRLSIDIKKDNLHGSISAAIIRTVRSFGQVRLATQPGTKRLMQIPALFTGSALLPKHLPLQY